MIEPLKIEKGVPISPKRGGIGLSATFRAMKVGDSVVVPQSRMGTIGSTAIRVWGKGHYAVRKVGDGNVRVWRTK